MPHFLVSFPASAMADLSPEELAQASVDSHAAIEDAKAAGVYVFGGGIDTSVAPVSVNGHGEVSAPKSPGYVLDGGFAVLRVASQDEAVAWAARLAAACRCPQEVRRFGDDPAS